MSIISLHGGARSGRSSIFLLLVQSITHLLKFLGSHPDAGVPPSVLTPNEILRCVSLYYLTQTFLSSIFTYAQNPMAFRHVYTMPNTDAPFLLSQFKYNVGFWPREVASTVGNLVEFRSQYSPPLCSGRSSCFSCGLTNS